MEFKRCMGCMREYEGEVPCPYCGFDIGEYRADSSYHQLLPGTVLNGKYVLGKVLGEGGFGISYLGWDLNLEHKVALKEYYPVSYVTRHVEYTMKVTTLPGARQEFYQKGLYKFVEEARSLAKFSGLPGIVLVRDYFQENGTAYIVMEFAEGETLKDVLSESGGRLPAELVFQLMEPVIESLEEIHKKGLIHRDISPDNMMVSPEWKVKLLDFGAARYYISGEEKSLSIVLKPGYTPEEQYRSRGEQGPWTDVYALCATMYKAITGEIPPESLDRMNEDELKPPSALGITINPQQEAALMKGLAIYKKDRYDSMHELWEALHQITDSVPDDKEETISSQDMGLKPKAAKKPVHNHKLTLRVKKKWKEIITGVAVAAVISLLFSKIPKGNSYQGESESKDTEVEVEMQDSEGLTKIEADLSEEDFLKVQIADFERWTDGEGSKITGFRNEYGNEQGIVDVINTEGTELRGYCANGVCRGYGELIWDDGEEWYAGNFIYGRKNGFGTYHWADGTVYKGEWSNGERNGLGVYFDEEGTYTAAVWEEGEAAEILEPAFTSSYRTCYLSQDTRFFGRGVIVYSDKDVYIGEIKEDKAYGWGCRLRSDDSYNEGQFDDWKNVGPETRYTKDGFLTISYNTGEGEENGPCVRLHPWAPKGEDDNWKASISEEFYKNGEGIQRINSSAISGEITTSTRGSDDKWKEDTGTKIWMEEDKLYMGTIKNGKKEGNVDFHVDGRHCMLDLEGKCYAEFYPFYNGTTDLIFGWDPSDSIEGWREGEFLYAYLQKDGRVGLGVYENGEFIPFEQ